MGVSTGQGAEEIMQIVEKCKEWGSLERVKEGSQDLIGLRMAKLGDEIKDIKPIYENEMQ